jgi:ribosomal protein L37AE/L43A
MVIAGSSWEDDAKYRDDWNGDYDGTDCPNCGRLRMLKCSNGKRRCEKCNWDPDAGDYSEYNPNR